MKTFMRSLLISWMVSMLVLSPRMVQLAWAQDDQDSASDEEVQILQQLAKNGYLGDKKDFYLSAKSLAEDDVTDALLKINDTLSLVDLKSIKPGNSPYRTE